MCKIPVKGSNNQEILALGIEPGPFEKGEVFREIKLPPNWSCNKIKKNHILIKDENNCERLNIFINKSRCEFKFCCRYSINKEYGLIYKEFVFDNKNKIVLFEVSFSPPAKRINLMAYNKAILSFQERQDCIKWLDDKYPNWNDFNTYWDD